MKKILILFGGNSHEHAISCKSAKTILTHIDKSLYNITAVGIDHQNNWYLYLDDINLIDESWKNRNIEKITNIIEFLKQFDKVFPIIHGNPEENGNIQGMFNLFDILYVGTDLLGSIISYDKELTKIICNHYQIPQVPYITITENKKIKNIPIPYPVIIKPAKCGSSIGINIANNIKELNKYVNLAFKYDNKVIIEKYIKARELECAILETNKIITSPIGEIRSSNTFYDYEAKYLKDSSLIIPANISKELSKEITELSKKIFNILSLSTLARIDFLYDYNEEKLYFNEVNTMPGFTDISMYPLLFKEVGINIKNLITKIIEK
ncbi:MAG: D-alanine--D-alanine ligase family protein [Bacilli bacterium]